jgi:trimeric autotransporter adhesin
LVRSTHNINGNHNTADGFLALSLNSTGTDNTATGLGAMFLNTTGVANTASGSGTLNGNTTGDRNTAFGANALSFNHTGSGNTAIGYGADVFMINLNNATAIGQGAFVDASDKIRFGNTDVSVIEGPVGFTSSFDRNRQESFFPVDGEDVLAKIRDLTIGSWNFTGQNPGRFRHYGPAAQDFFAAFGRDGVGSIGTPTTITSTDMDGILMIAAQALETRTLTQEQRALGQAKEVEALRAENRHLSARLEALERAIRERR